MIWFDSVFIVDCVIVCVRVWLIFQKENQMELCTHSPMLSIAYVSNRLPFVSDAKLSVDDELLTMVYRFNGRFFGLLRIVCCVNGWFELWCVTSMQFTFVGDIDNRAKNKIWLKITYTYVWLIKNILIKNGFCLRSYLL